MLHCHVSFSLSVNVMYVSLQCVSSHLEGQVGDDAGESEDHQQQVGEDEGSGGVDDLLDLFVGSAGLAGLPGERNEEN